MLPVPGQVIEYIRNRELHFTEEIQLLGTTYMLPIKDVLNGKIAIIRS